MARNKQLVFGHVILGNQAIRRYDVVYIDLLVTCQKIVSPSYGCAFATMTHPTHKRAISAVILKRWLTQLASSREYTRNSCKSRATAVLTGYRSRGVLT